MSNNKLPKLSIFVGSSIVLVIFMYYAMFVNYDIMLPVGSLFFIITTFILIILKINKEMAPVFELGPFYAIIVFIYAIFPLSFYMLNGMKFSLISDERLFFSSPTPKEMSEVAWYYVVYLLFFTVSYTLLRIKKLPSNVHYDTKSKNCDAVFFGVAVFTYVLLTIFLAVIGRIYHLNEATSYSDSYLVVWQLPTFLRQINNHLISIKMTLQLILLVGLMKNFNKNKYIIFAWLLFELISSSVALQSRTGMMFLLLSATLAYNYFVKPIKLITILTMMFSMLLLFTILGQLRTSSNILLNSGLLGILTHNEFEAVFGTLYHFHNNTISTPVAIDISWFTIWTSDITNLFPQQILPFVKVDLSYIYTKNFVPELLELGGNFPGGTLLEAMMGLGLFDACLKGLVVGVLFAYIYRSCILNNKQFIKSVFYIWVTVLSYKTFSRGTFLLVPSVFYDFILPIVAITFVSNIIKGAVINVNRPLKIQQPNMIQKNI